MNPLTRPLTALAALVLCATASACGDDPASSDEPIPTSSTSAPSEPAATEESPTTEADGCPVGLTPVSEFAFSGIDQSVEHYQLGDVVYLYANMDDEWGGWRLDAGQLTPLPESWLPAGVTDSGVVLVSEGLDPAVAVVDEAGGTVWQNTYDGQQIERDSILAGTDEILIHDKHTDATFVAVSAATGEQVGDPFEIADAYNPASPPVSSDVANTGDYWFEVSTRQPVTEIDGPSLYVVPGSGSWLGVDYDQDIPAATLHTDGSEQPVTLPEVGFPIGVCGDRIVIAEELGGIKVVDLAGEGETIGTVGLSDDGTTASVDGQYLTVVTTTYGSDAESGDYEYAVTVYGP